MLFPKMIRRRRSSTAAAVVAFQFATAVVFVPQPIISTIIPPAADQPDHLRNHYKNLADNHLKECLTKPDQASCESASVCTWCHAPGKPSNGVCFPTMYASVAQCDQWEDMNTKCMLAGLPDDQQDPKELCGKAADGEGKACKWCEVMFGAGICMDETQAQVAGRWLTCDGRSGDGGRVEKE